MIRKTIRVTYQKIYLWSILVFTGLGQTKFRKKVFQKKKFNIIETVKLTESIFLMIRKTVRNNVSKITVLLILSDFHKARTKKIQKKNFSIKNISETVEATEVVFIVNY